MGGKNRCDSCGSKNHSTGECLDEEESDNGISNPEKLFEECVQSHMNGAIKCARIEMDCDLIIQSTPTASASGFKARISMHVNEVSDIYTCSIDALACHKAAIMTKLKADAQNRVAMRQLSEMEAGLDSFFNRARQNYRENGLAKSSDLSKLFRDIGVIS